jgi:hypothetical protein
MNQDKTPARAMVQRANCTYWVPIIARRSDPGLADV